LLSRHNPHDIRRSGLTRVNAAIEVRSLHKLLAKRLRRRLCSITTGRDHLDARWAGPWGICMRVFSELSNIQGVAKRVKFKHGILLRATHEQGRISDEHFELVKGEACATYVMAWRYSGNVRPTPGRSPNANVSLTDLSSTNNQESAVQNFREVA